MEISIVIFVFDKFKTWNEAVARYDSSWGRHAYVYKVSLQDIQ